MTTRILRSRRSFLVGGAALVGMAAPAVSGAAALIVTPPQPLGPFYPDVMPLDLDNDLVRLEGRAAAAAGVVTHVYGRVADTDGRPMRGALVEIWQCDSRGRYIHTADSGRGPSDANFQGYGRTVTDQEGRYRFRTIRPVPYSWRAPHIHFQIKGRGFGTLVTQMYIAGERRNDRDGLLQSVRDPAARRALIVPLAANGNIEPGALAGRFDIVLGRG